ncbi:MAG: hypothetical protein ABF904_14940 [Ethanoligenens sp.]
MTLREISSFVLTGDRPAKCIAQKTTIQAAEENEQVFLQQLRAVVSDEKTYSNLLFAYNAVAGAWEESGHQCGMQDGARLVIDLLDTGTLPPFPAGLTARAVMAKRGS